MGNNGGLLLCIIITHYYIRIMSCVHVIMSSFLHIITYYYMLLHIAAFLLLTPCVMSWQVPGPAHQICWIPQMMMFWSPTRLSPKPCGAVDRQCSSATVPQWTAAHGGTVLRDLLAVTMNKSASTQGFTFSSFCFFRCTCVIHYTR